MLPVQFKRQWEMQEGARGDVRLFPAGLTVRIEPLVAAYLEARGIGAIINTVPPEIAAEVAAQRQIIAALEAHNIEPTLEAVQAEIAALHELAARQLAEAEPAAAAEKPPQPKRGRRRAA